MPDIYANITSAAPRVVEQIADVLELRAADPKQGVMREAYLSDRRGVPCVAPGWLARGVRR
jgi:hypothetical protein